MYKRRIETNCKVVSASFYKKSNFIADKDEWIKKIKEEENCKYYVNQDSLIDDRTRAWCAIPLHDLVEPLLTIRSEFKAKNDKNKEQFYKNIINSLYGVLASRYFSVSNTILTNNITDTVRTQIWMLSRPLNAIQTITDGCSFELNNIFQLKKKIDKKPGLATLSNLEKLKNHRSIKAMSLNGLDWKTILNERDSFYIDNINDYVTKHCDEFWQHYDLKINYNLIHKMEHLSFEMYTFKKTNYMLKNINGEVLVVIRGLKSMN